MTDQVLTVLPRCQHLTGRVRGNLLLVAIDADSVVAKNMIGPRIGSHGWTIPV